MTFVRAKCRCGKMFYSGYAFSSHRCEFKKNAGAYIKAMKQHN